MKLKYDYNARSKVQDLITAISKLKKAETALNVIKKKAVKLEAELEIQKSIDVLEAKLKDTGIPSYKVAVKIEEYYNYLEYCSQLCNDTWILTGNDNAYPTVISQKNIDSNKFHNKLKKYAPFNTDGLYHVSNEAELWQQIKKHFINNLKPFGIPCVDYLSKYIIFDDSVYGDSHIISLVETMNEKIKVNQTG